MIPGCLCDRHSRMVLAVKHDQIHTALILPPQLLHHSFSGRRQSGNPSARLKLCLHTHRHTVSCTAPCTAGIWWLWSWSVCMPASESNVYISSGSWLGTYNCSQCTSRLVCSGQLTGLYCHASVTMYWFWPLVLEHVWTTYSLSTACNSLSRLAAQSGLRAEAALPWAGTHSVMFHRCNA